MAKIEIMTCLRANEFVRKDSPEINFRGGLDTLIAEFVLFEARCLQEGNRLLASDTGELRALLLAIMGAHVGLTSVELPEKMFGVYWAELQSASHNPRKYFGVDHFNPTPQMGVRLARVNLLRAKTRDLERTAVTAFAERGEPFEGIILALNRASSALYVMLCMLRSGRYD